jgi:hypothetical protein
MSTATDHSRTTPTALGPATIAQLLAAVAVAVGGLLHLKDWDESKKDLPSQIPGVWVVQEGFLVNAAASLVLAALLVATAFGALIAFRRFVIPAALALEMASIAALLLSRGPGVFGWQEKGAGYQDRPGQILAVEIAAVVLLVVAFGLTNVGTRREA